MINRNLYKRLEEVERKSAAAVEAVSAEADGPAGAIWAILRCAGREELCHRTIPLRAIERCVFAGAPAAEAGIKRGHHK
jgi:hypothetical protein